MIKVQCGHVTDAQSLFDSSTNKTLAMYGAMMKGKSYLHIWKHVLLDYFRLSKK